MFFISVLFFPLPSPWNPVKLGKGGQQSPLFFEPFFFFFFFFFFFGHFSSLFICPLGQQERGHSGMPDTRVNLDNTENNQWNERIPTREREREREREMNVRNTSNVQTTRGESRLIVKLNSFEPLWPRRHGGEFSEAPSHPPPTEWKKK